MIQYYVLRYHSLYSVRVSYGYTVPVYNNNNNNTNKNNKEDQTEPATTATTELVLGMIRNKSTVHVRASSNILLHGVVCGGMKYYQAVFFEYFRFW